MCGRYAFVPHARAWASIDDLLGVEVSEALLALEARYNAAPTQRLPIVVEDATSRVPVVALARWGLVPGWWREAKPPQSTINARSEDAASKPMWREAWRTARCLVPASHYYEWMKAQGGKVPHALSPAGGEGFMFAGLWASRRDPASGDEVTSFAILTRAAAPAIAHIHDRMPVILAPQIWRLWIDRDLRPGLGDPHAARQQRNRRARLCRGPARKLSA